MNTFLEIDHLSISNLITNKCLECPFEIFGREILSKHSFDDGVIVFNEVLNINPNSIWGNLFLGRCLYELGEFEQAINSFRNVTKLDCNNKIAINNLSFLFMHQSPVLRRWRTCRVRWV